MKKTLALVFAFLVIVTCFAACGNSQHDDTTILGIEDIKVPEENLNGVKKNSFSKFTAVNIAGNKITEDILKGKKLTMIKIWATFCGPCINEMPEIARLHTDYADKDFQVLGIISDITYLNGGYEKSLFNDALDIIAATGVNYTNLLPSKSLDIIKLNEVYSVPETIFVDENGNIIGESYIGSRSYENWKIIIDDILASMDA